MQVKSLGPFSVGSSFGSEREEAVASLRSTSFVRAQPPQATPKAGHEEVKQGLLRMADYLHKLQAKTKRKKKTLNTKDSTRRRALMGYQQAAQLETSDELKGQSLSLFI